MNGKPEREEEGGFQEKSPKILGCKRHQFFKSLKDPVWLECRELRGS